MDAVLLAQFRAVQALLSAVQAQFDALALAAGVVGAGTADESAACSHPDVEDVGTFGASETRCTVCKAIVG